MNKLWIYKVGVAFLTALVCLTASGRIERKPNQIDYSTYFLADLRDAEECSMEYRNGRFIFPAQITNPATTCPDMFSWKLFVDAVKDRFWSRWADELQNWPDKPYPLCSQGDQPVVNCCQPGADNNPADHCPVFPGRRYADKLNQLTSTDRAHIEALLADSDLERAGLPSITEHGENVLEVAEALANNTLKECTTKQLNQRLPGLIPQSYESIGRVIRQTNAELTVRNEPFHNYLFRNNLYNADGVKDVFNKNAENIPANAPYHYRNFSANEKRPRPDLARIDLPADAVMIKSNWLHEELAKKLGISNNPQNPFITRHMKTILNPTSDKANPCEWAGLHYLVAFHISSKDIPQWVWATFEHVNLPGRCDITGCNDAYGYRNNDPTLPAGLADNYVPPKVRGDQLNSSRIVFARDHVYPAEAIRPGLQAVLMNAKIGTGSSAIPHEPQPTDRAWLSYRLKGSQIEYTDLHGRPTILANSVTEAGFVGHSSCVSCHSRAGVHIAADGSHSFFKLGVFELQHSNFGYAESSFGIPEENWFHDSASPPRLQVLQTDFVWGFLFAKPLQNP